MNHKGREQSKEERNPVVKTKKIVTAGQKKLTHTITGQLQRARSLAKRSRHGECWPQSNGHEKTVMWQSTGWPASGKNIPRIAQSFLSHSKNL
jgi:hypothetical protein